MPKKMSETEKQQKKWQKDLELACVIKCNKCNRVMEILINPHPKWAKCICNNIIINNDKLVSQNCSILYERQ